MLTTGSVQSDGPHCLYPMPFEFIPGKSVHYLYFSSHLGHAMFRAHAWRSAWERGARKDMCIGLTSVNGGLVTRRVASFTAVVVIHPIPSYTQGGQTEFYTGN